jgi:hypothetical protein
MLILCARKQNRYTYAGSLVRTAGDGAMSRYDRPSHRVYMTFFFREVWQVQFVESDLKTPLPRMFTFADPEKIRELARRGEAWGTSEARQMLEYGIEAGRGGTYLRLTPEQFWFECSDSRVAPLRAE